MTEKNFEHKTKTAEDERLVEVTPEAVESFEQVANETVEDIDRESAAFLENNEQAIDKIDAASGLESADLDEAKEELELVQDIKALGEKIKNLARNTKEKLAKIFSSKESENTDLKIEKAKEQPESIDGVKEQPESTDDVESFNPEEELAEIRKLPREERKQALEDFKERLVEQKSGMAKMQTQIENEIMQNPDLSRDELMDKIFQKGAELKMNRKQLALAEGVVNEYIGEQQRVKELREQYPNDEDLFQALYGKKPQGKITAKVRPGTILFEVHDIDDYTYILASVDNKHAMAENGFSDEDKKKANGVQGFCAWWNLDPLLKSTIVVKMEGLDNPKIYNEVINHEQKHSFDSLFSEAKSTGNAKQELLNSQTEQEREAALHRYFMEKRRVQGDVLAKDEIIAYNTGDPNKTPVEISVILTREGDTYNYFNNAKDNLKKHLGKDLIDKMGEEEFDGMVDKVFQEVYVDEYQKTVEDGAQAFYDLRIHGHVGVAEAASMLIHEPLHKWKTVVKRVLAEKDKKGSESQRILTENIQRQAEMSNPPNLWLHAADKDRKPPAPNRKQF